MPKSNIPTLEYLVNQCCEDYYFKLPDTCSEQLELPKEQQFLKPEESAINEKYFSHLLFKEFIVSSHCQENLKFLIEIYHYEKIWNKIFKRQSSILKCKDESIVQQRKQSVATIFTNHSSLRLRKHSIMEEPEFPDKENSAGQTSSRTAPPISHSPDTMDNYSPSSEVKLPDGILTTPTEEIEEKKLVNPESPTYLPELVLPHVVRTETEIDTDSFVKQDSTHTHLKGEKAVLSEIPTSMRSHGGNSEVWDSLFKPSFCDQPNTECLCNDDVHNHELRNLNTVEEDEYNDSVRQLEIREKLKEELYEKFNFIIRDFVLDNSPYEINLPANVYSNLILEYENNKILYHSPLTLLPAKNAVLQLLRENIYYKFLSKQQALLAKDSELSLEKKETPSNTTITLQPSSDISNKDLKVQQPKPLHITRSIDSRNSEDSRKESSPPISISNLLNKYHIKIHNDTPPRNESPLSISASSNSSLRLKTRAMTFNSTEELQKQHQKNGPPKSNSNNNIAAHSHHNPHYVKGPCGIEPNINAYDPKPPLEKANWGSRLFKFRKKKKEAVQ